MSLKRKNCYNHLGTSSLNLLCPVTRFPGRAITPQHSIQCQEMTLRRRFLSREDSALAGHCEAGAGCACDSAHSIPPDLLVKPDSTFRTDHFSRESLRYAKDSIRMNSHFYCTPPAPLPHPHLLQMIPHEMLGKVREK